MTEVLDMHGNTITVGTRVKDELSDDPSGGGVVTEISDPDGDVDEYGRAVGIPPYVTVTYDDGSTERYRASWNATGPWDDHRDDYTCDDLEIAVEALSDPLDWHGQGVNLTAVGRLERFAAQYPSSLGRPTMGDHEDAQRLEDAYGEPDGQRVEGGRIVPTDR